MALKVLVHDVVLLYREIEMPERCPGCDSDLTEEGSIDVHEYQDQSRTAHLKRSPGRVDDLEYEDDLPQGGDAFVEVAFQCRECDHEFAMGHEINVEGDEDLWLKIKELVDR